jgi:two-component system, NarL family, nitrate/nitrite response regulator NarL
LRRRASRYPGHRHAMSPHAALRVLVVDDHELFRTGLRALLEEEGFVVADAASGQAALAALPSFVPDVVVMDLNMPGMSGAEATRRVVREMPGARVLMLTITREARGVLDAVRAGALGYLLKDAELEDIATGIREAAAGRPVFASAATGAMMAEVRRGAPRIAAPATAAVVAQLTARERAVLALLARGCDNTEISRQLFVSPSTVKHHVSHVLEKLGVENRLQAATFAIRNGLADDSGDSG